eukprot:CAMPEP_0178400876 /NCGR_PEP_ID=MMETSP0689_2-20121128/16013_1 /TAXON_ID=160604 /ORGANISM="Amphidinium massartii, Strain CS-259" /LENGTH=119 /DNA_ID=CAMNT_0020021681 /DNA_START=82 /DNA_END=441 /DNA_ORIENTATION=-
MVERLTYRRHCRYNTKSNKRKTLRTPGGKLVYQVRHKKVKGPHCGDTGLPLRGMPAVKGHAYRRLKKRQKHVSRAYGGSRCGEAVRKRVLRAFLIEEQKCVKQVLAEKMSQSKEKVKKK